MKTTIYLIRHSIRFNNDYIEKYNTTQNKTIKNEKIVLYAWNEFILLKHDFDESIITLIL